MSDIEYEELRERLGEVPLIDVRTEDDLVLAMDQRQLSAIRALAPQARGKTFLLGHWIDAAAVADPYGQPRSAFEECHALIERAVDAWVAHL